MDLHKKIHWAEDRLDELLEDIKDAIVKNQRPANEVILDDKGVMQMLNICKRSLASLRSSGTIVWSKIGGKIYYKLSDVLEMLERNRINVQRPEKILFKRKKGSS
jgi:hypothetical protein